MKVLQSGGACLVTSKGSPKGEWTGYVIDLDAETVGPEQNLHAAVAMMSSAKWAEATADAARHAKQLLSRAAKKSVDNLPSKVST